MADNETRNTPRREGTGSAPSGPASTPTRPGKPGGKRGKKRPARIDRRAPQHQARVLAMQALYEDDLTGHGLDEILQHIGEQERGAHRDYYARVRTGARKAIEEIAFLARNTDRGVVANRESIDPTIEKAAPAFPIPQLASIDRAVLRIAVYELQFEPEVPFKAVINEGVEIAKQYGGPHSGRFVNGVLRTISERLPAARTEGTAPRADG